MFDRYLKKWRLSPDGEAIITHSSRLLPVQLDGMAAMLKIALDEEERFGGELMMWWDGQGAARVLAYEENALLLERAQGKNSLVAWSRAGRDAAATRVLCASIAQLHLPRRKALPELIPLTHWFKDLFPAAERHGGWLIECATIARELLNQPREEGVLHGDIHHGNILDFAERGWLAIDPKRLWGERAFDYANLFCNPDAALATNKELFLKRLDIVSETAGLERKRLLQWIMAWAALSAAWRLDDGSSPELNLSVALLAAEELARL